MDVPRRTRLYERSLLADGSLMEFVLSNLRKNSAEYLLGLDEEGVEEMTRHGIRIARGYGLSDPVDLLTFVTVMFQVAPNFHCHPKINAVLTEPSIRPDQKFDVLTDPRFDLAWDEADAEYDPEAWMPVEEAEDDVDDADVFPDP